MTVLEKPDIAQDTILIGIGASPGIAIGETYLLNRARMHVDERRISPAEVQEELHAFRKALDLSRQQLEEVKRKVSDRHLSEHLYIIDTHLLILDDQMLVEETERSIEHDLINAGGALKKTLGKFRNFFESIEDEYLRERRTDIDSVGERILRNLMGEIQQTLTEIEGKVVLVAHDLSPADTMQMEKEKIIGFVTDVGGRTSHTAILARSLAIPAVVGMETASTLLPENVPVIIDGTSGTVILNPSPVTFREYLEKKQSYEYFERELLSYRKLPSETLDGRRIALRGNVELTEEIPLSQHYGAEGIGLFRTEFLYMNRPLPPSEEEQVQIYRKIAEEMAPHSVTIRTLDVGGDKFVPEINLTDENNPAMGLRAIRFSIKERHLFMNQLKAILRASAFGKIRLLFPMISGIEEIRICKSCLKEAKNELIMADVPFDPDMPVGIMIETPSAAILADFLAKEVDFFSVGTNDLIQYCLAVDRGNEHVAYLYDPLHPAVLRALKMICDAAKRAGIGLGMCGEMASEPLYSMILVGLGFAELSMNAPGVPRVKRLLRQLRADECERFVESLFAFSTTEDISKVLEEEMKRRFPDIVAPSFS